MPAAASAAISARRFSVVENNALVVVRLMEDLLSAPVLRETPNAPTDGVKAAVELAARRTKSAAALNFIVLEREMSLTLQLLVTLY